MDPAQYKMARDHFFRLQDMAPQERLSELERLEAKDPRIGAYVRSLIEADAESAAGDDLFEQAIQGGVAEQARSIAQPLELRTGDRVGSYTISKLLGRGGFGDVYLAEQTSPHRRVALKILKAGMDSASVLRRFDHERQILASLSHPNIARLYESGYVPPELGSRPFFAMEFVDGPPLNSYCDTQGLNVNARLELFIDVCRAVQHAHTKGVMHRDLKPSNILISPDEGGATPKVIDFGIAKAIDHRMSAGTQHTTEGQLIGTLAYMSPEQAGAGDVDTRTDVYALGVILYELLTGSLPFNAKTLANVPPLEAQRIIRETNPEKPSTRLTSKTGPQARHTRDRMADARLLRNELDWIVMRCLEKEPGRRYASPDALAEDLRRFLSGDPVLARPPSRMYQAQKFTRKHRVPIASAVTVLLAVLVSVIIAMDASKRVEISEFQDQIKQTNQAKDEALKSAEQLKATIKQRDTVIADNDRINKELKSTNEQLLQKSAELNEKNRELEQSVYEKSQLASEMEELAKQETLAKQAAQKAEADLQKANDELERALAVRDAARIQAEEDRRIADEASRQSEVDAERARAEAERADLEAEKAQRALAELDHAVKSVRGLSQADHISSNLLREMADALGKDNLLGAQLLHRLANRSLSDGDMVRAAELQLESFQSYRGALGSDHPSTLRSQLQLVDMLLRAGDEGRANWHLGILRDAAQRRAFSDRTLHTDIELASATHSLYKGNRDDALRMLSTLVQELESAFGPHDVRTLKAVRRRAMVHAAMGNATAAEADYRRVLTLTMSATDEGLEEVAIASNNIALILRSNGRDAEAEAHLGRAVRTAGVVWGLSNWRTAMVQAQHASVLAALGTHDIAERKLLNAYDVLASALGRQHTETRAIARELVLMYQAWDAATGTNRHASDIRKWTGVLAQR